MVFQQRKKSISLLFSFILLVLMLVSSVQPAIALDSRYLRNGECYMLIGGGTLSGVYRFNNPVIPMLYTPPKYLFPPTSSVGFSVDLNRKIYTFSEGISPSWVLSPDKLKRQVLDDVSADLSDWGYHQYYHYDHRPWGRRSNVYRVARSGGTIRDAWGRAAPFKSNGPGSPISAQNSSVLPNITTPSAAVLNVIPGKNWYQIPNPSWYSSQKLLPRWRRQQGYVVFGDKVMERFHNWRLYSWESSNPNAVNPNYGQVVGPIVANPSDKRFYRNVYAGCLDGCGGANGSGEADALPMVTDLAFTPPVATSSSRTYFYSRPEGKTTYEITKNMSRYNPPSDNALIGLPRHNSTKWIAVSLRDANSDYVYCIGSKTIQNWYNEVTNTTGKVLDISAISISNQWDQSGGIVYAYDQTDQLLYKFDRIDDGSDTPLSTSRYQAFAFGDTDVDGDGVPEDGILSQIGADAASSIDDIEADGFGNLFFGLNYPSLQNSTYNPAKNFTIDQAVHLKVEATDATDPNGSAFLIYKQDYGKYIFKRDIYDGSITEMGHKTYATKYYNVAIRINKLGLAELSALTLPSTTVGDVLASWSAEIGDDNGTINEFDFGEGSANVYPPSIIISDAPPVHLAVINVPTPPKVLSLGGNSLLDIIGPYTDIPIPDLVNRNTNQHSNLLNPAPAVLEADKLYFYMVENYPLDDGPQNPATDSDWDGDGKMGGFISALVNPHSSAHVTEPGRVFYEWRTWLVEDMFGNMIAPAKLISGPRSDPNNTGQDHWMYFYSPVQGKYLLTCRVRYDWYDYDALPFGSTISSLESIKKTNIEAIPSAAGDMAQTSAPTLLNNIMSSSSFSFMAASSTQYLSQIAPSNNFTIIPVVVGVATDTPPPPPAGIASIQRCDGTSINLANNPSNNDHWFTGKAYPPLYPDEFHGLKAGKEYLWRINIASQTNMFFSIGSPSAQITNANNPNTYDYVAAMIMNPASPLYVNSNPKFAYRKLGYDLRWKVPGSIKVSAYLEYKVPDGAGGVTTDKQWLIGEDGEEAEFNPSLFSADKPIICSTNSALPPTDPYDADLVITMKRWFEYDAWIDVSRPSDSAPIWGNSITLPKQLTITAKTKVRIVDSEAPRVVFAKTKPVNLFGITGKELTVGDGPGGSDDLINPDKIVFTVRDNNPWEAIEGVNGVTKAESRANQILNAGLALKTASTDAPTAKNNYLPVFSKENSWTNISFESSSRLDNGFNPIITASASTQFAEDSKYSSTATDSYIIPNFSTATSNDGASPVTYRSEVEYSVALGNIRLGAGSTKIIPKGYANNTPGYVKNPVFNISGNLIGGELNPYRFYTTLRDSSGNYIKQGNGNVLPQMLNLALHVKDDIPPVPYGILHEYKGDTVRYFPSQLNVALSVNGGTALGSLASSTYTPANIRNYTFNEGYIDRSTTWLPSKIPQGYINTGQFQSLMSMGDNIVRNFVVNGSSDDAAKLRAQIDNFVPPYYLEDNVEFTIHTGVSDNAGAGVATLTFKYLDTKGDEFTRVMSSNWTSSIATDTTGTIASETHQAMSVFRGRDGDFPMAIPIKITAKDNAREWDYYYNDGIDSGSAWSWGTAYYGPQANNPRTFKTTIPVYGSKLIIRTLDQGVRNK